MYADDMMVLSEYRNELKEMLNAVTEYGKDSEVRLCKDKNPSVADKWT